MKTKISILFLLPTVVLLSACGGGSSSDGSQPEPPTEPLANFGNTISELVVPEGSTTLPDGNTFNEESDPIELANYVWEIDESDVDESDLDEVFAE